MDKIILPESMPTWCDLKAEDTRFIRLVTYHIAAHRFLVICSIFTADVDPVCREAGNFAVTPRD